jgi:hypothetical protein
MDQHDRAWMPPSIATARLWALEDMATSVRARPRRHRLRATSRWVGRRLGEVVASWRSRRPAAVGAPRAYRWVRGR